MPRPEDDTAPALRQARPVTRSRRAGLIVAGTAAALWLVVLVSFFSADPDEGVNLGAALLSMLAFPLSMAGAVLLLLSLRAERRETTGVRRLAVPRRAAGVLTVLAMAMLATVFVVVPADSLSPDLMVALLLSGIGAFLAAFALYLMPVDDA
jgi:peptidoglycan/LPS O-acetylase OafA/YrhL